ncbi:MMPL family transporter [Streptomyces olivaceus]|uniref:MMPL family transporter n=1 Tax=Streptomyces olivaceus TaxID=47716 RepID=UPI001CCEEAE0|nr:MMPL family transporter [Streptomyces olivaceus]MBZ6192175.1 MMPL family transporter [Streptomyces olivaceus]MBZ6199692.1 MMPL family transporter [Streptomyces olivaceus]MBZ6205919.1 MMPL family transporter [Streptomyces olivaceus]GHI99901.1 membrane protein [Streptomyces olivaceus]
MATFLYRMGRAAFGRRRLVLLLWAVLLGVAGAAAAKAPPAGDDGTSFMPGIEAQRAFDLIGERFPGSDADGASARVVFIAPGGEKVTAGEHRAAVDAFVADAGDGPRVAGAVSPFAADAVSEDASVAYATVTYKVGSADLTDADRSALEAAVDEARDSGLTVEVGGNALASQPAAGGAAEAVGIGLAAVVLLITFGSLAAAGLPLLTAVVGVGISICAILALGSALGLSMTTGTLASMLGLAVGIDYALFVVSRYREERERGHAAREAAGLAVGTAGSAVVFAGLTVVIALAGLSVVGVPMLTKMGLCAAGAVVVAVLVALTLVPALLAMWPEAVLSRTARRGGSHTTGERTAVEHTTGERTTGERRTGAADNGGSRWARFVLRRPVAVLLACVAGLGVLALPAADLQLGMPGDEAKPVTTTERRAYDALADGFGPGFNGPLTIVADVRDAADPQAAVAAIASRIEGTDGVVSLSPPQLNGAGDTALFSAVPATAPNDERTKELVQTIRAERPGLEDETGAVFEVTGSTAMNIDVAQALQDALVPYLAVVMLLSLLLLMLVFRSVLVPLKAAFGFLLSVLASLGVVVAVFQWGWGAGLLGVEQAGPIMSLMPVFLVGIVFGLAMDYEVFLVSRMREAYVHGERPAQAVVGGFRHSARVVVAAAVIMIAVFSGFVGSGESMIKTIGFGLAVAVLFDAFVVRMALVPAVLALLGDRAWWLPRPLDRLLPRVDIEGTGLAGRSAPVRAPAGGDAQPQEPREAART